MLSRLRRQIALIRYYSAPRRSTPLGRVADAAVLTALALALPATWVLDRVAVGERTRQAASGLVVLDASSAVVAEPWVDGTGPQTRTDAEAIGRFEVTRTARRHGWPYVSSLRDQRVEAVVTLHDASRPLRDLEDDAALRGAIVSALVEAGLEEEAALLLGGDAGGRVVIDHRLAGWSANAILLAIALPVITWLGFSIVRLAAAVARRSRVSWRLERRDAGRCEVCGYDLRGSLFSARCPECGSVV